MAVHNSYPSRAKQKAEQVARQAVDHPWFERLARFGYASKGIVYLLAGLFSARAAFGLGGQTTDKNGALLALLAEPFGQLVLILIAVGLVGFVLLRFVQAFMDPERKGSDAKGIAVRAGYAINGLLYGTLALTAARLAIGAHADTSSSLQGWVATLFGHPLGRWLVGIAGLIVLGGGLQLLYKAYTRDFSEHFRWDAMSAYERTWTTWLGRAGLAARGIVQGLIGAFMIQAALRFDASRVQGTGGALQSLAHPPFGLWTIGVVAVGLAAYGIYMLAAAKYSRIVTR
jgi:uncharacterized protein DUF1206